MDEPDVGTTILSRLSHGFRTPLNAIIGFAEILGAQSAGPLTEKQAKYVGLILDSGQKLLRMIGDLLDLEQMTPAQLQLAYQPFDVGVAISDVIGISEDAAVDKCIMMEVTVAPETQQLNADPQRIRQVLHNLLSNAVKFCPDEYGSIFITVGPAGAADVAPLGEDAPPLERFVKLSISDNGIGVSPEDQQRIFKEFEQVDASYSRSYKGIGLGLALSHRLVTLHGGRIWVESELGKGSTFIFVIPALGSD